MQCSVYWVLNTDYYSPYHEVQSRKLLWCKFILDVSEFLFFYVAQQVQTDQNISTENLQVEMRELDKHLEAMEQRGVELERNLRDCKNGSPNRSRII